MSQLRRFDVTSGRRVDVPPAVSDNLTALKHDLRDLILEVTTAPGAPGADPDVLAARVVAQLESEDVPVGDTYGGFGAIEGIEFRRPPENPAWLIATTSLSIPYGTDTSLYLFEIQGSSWKHVLTVESNGYKTISGAQGWLRYYVAPQIPGKKPYLVTADVTPWDISVWQTLRLKVLRVGAKPESPVVLATRALGYCLDDDYHLSMRADGFGLIYLGYPVDRELAGWRGVHYLEYAAADKRASIVKEVAVDPYNVIKKWGVEDWAVASRSVDASARDNVREWHRRFRAGRWACGLGPIHLGHQLRSEHDELLAEIECSQGGDTTPSAFVLLAPNRNGFHIASVSGTKALPESSGQAIYNAGGPGLTDPIPETILQPRLPADVAALTAGQIKLRLGIVVNEDGSIGSVSVPDWPDDQSKIVVPAIQAVRGWKYKPGLKDGRPVKVLINLTVMFEP